MKFLPRGQQIVGRVVIKRMLTSIMRPDETKNTTKFVLIDAVGPDAAAKGLKVGDVVLPTKMGGISLDGGVNFRPIIEADNVAIIVKDVTLEELSVQVEGGTKYVAFDDPDAAKSLAVVESDYTAGTTVGTAEAAA